MKVSSTIAYERDHNELLRLDRRGRVRRADDRRRSAPQPPNFQAIVALNRGPLRRRPRRGRSRSRRARSRQAAAAGALVVDVRTDLQFDDAHIPGAVCNPARARRLRHEARVGRRPRAGRRARRPRRRGRAARRAARGARSASRNIAGYLAGGMTSWREEQRADRGVERIDVPALHERCATTAADPRRPRARRVGATGHIPGCRPRPLPRHRRRPRRHRRVDGPLAVICSSGQRSAVAAIAAAAPSAPST